MYCHRDGAGVPVVSGCGLKGIVGIRTSGELFVSQSDHRIDSHRAVRGEIGRKDGNANQDG